MVSISLDSLCFSKSSAGWNSSINRLKWTGNALSMSPALAWITSALIPSLSFVITDLKEASRSVSCSPASPTECAVRFSLSSRVSTVGPLSLVYVAGDVCEAASVRLPGEVISVGNL